MLNGPGLRSELVDELLALVDHIDSVESVSFEHNFERIAVRVLLEELADFFPELLWALVGAFVDLDAHGGVMDGRAGRLADTWGRLLDFHLLALSVWQSTNATIVVVLVNRDTIVTIRGLY